jgi:hypothetical protein
MYILYYQMPHAWKKGQKANARQKLSFFALSINPFIKVLS